MSSLRESDWVHLLVDLGCSTTTASKWAPAAAAEWNPALFSRGMDDLHAMLPQVLHESTGRASDGSYRPLERVEENLNYTTAERICAVWPSRFPSVADAQPYVRNPEALANKVYNGRMGNEEAGDGWRYRGRGPIMLTGHEAYRKMGELIGMDLETSPQFVLEPMIGCAVVRYWWEGNIPDGMLSDTVKVRRRVNGGTVGLDHVQALAEKVKEALA